MIPQAAGKEKPAGGGLVSGPRMWVLLAKVGVAVFFTMLAVMGAVWLASALMPA